MDNYEKLKEIGKGSYGVVCLVKNKKDKKNYVMKKIDLRQTTARDIESAQQEAKLLSKLKHPNIVAYRDSFQTNGYLYIVMLYCEGGDLYTKIKEQNSRYLDEMQVVEWFVQIAMALQYMHERHILHRDLKTQNIFLTKNKIVKVGDLGIARVLKGNNDMATTVIGTPYYMSPELFSNKPYNSKSDVWALGCCVYEMATLKHAFNAKDMNSLVYKILRGKMPAVPNVYSKELIQLIESTLNADANKRPSVNKILRDPYIRHNINLFLERTKQRQKQSTNENKSSVDAFPSPSRLDNYSSYPLSDLSPSQLNGVDDRRVPIAKEVNNILNSDSETDQKPNNNNNNRKRNQVAKSTTNSNNNNNNNSKHMLSQSPSDRQSSLTKEINSILNSDSETDQNHHRQQQQQNHLSKRSPLSSPSLSNSKKMIVPSAVELSREPHQMQPVRQKRFVRISSIVNDIETLQQMEINDHQQRLLSNSEHTSITTTTTTTEGNPNNESGPSNRNVKQSTEHNKNSSASSSIESIENKDSQTPKIISNNNKKPITCMNSPVISEKSENRQNDEGNHSSLELLGKVNQSARERRRLKLRLSAQTDNSSDSKPPLLKKVEKIPRPTSAVTEVDGIIAGGGGQNQIARAKSASSIQVSKSYGEANANPSEFPFKDSLKLIRNNSKNVQINDNVKVINPNSKISTNIQKTPEIPIPISKSQRTSKNKTKFNGDTSSSSTDVDEDDEFEPEKLKIKQREKDRKEVDNLVTLLNTTLHTLNNYNKQGDMSEADEFEEPLEDDIDDYDMANQQDPNLKQKSKQQFDDDFPELKILENINNTTLGATRRMHDRIVALEKDCINGIGRARFEQAYEILEYYRDEEIEPKLLDLLGRNNFNNYAGKIWQLKFFKDSERLSRR